MRSMKLSFLVKLTLLTLLVIALGLGCAPSATTNGTSTNAAAGNAMATVAQVAATAPGLAQQLNGVYAYLVAQKAVPDNLDLATMALQKLDEIAPVVQAGAEALNQPGKFDWAQAAIQLALTVAQVMGYVLPLVV